MKHNRLASLMLASLGVITLGVSACSEPTSSTSVPESQTSVATSSQTTSTTTTVVPQSIKKLVVSKDPNKLLYEVGEAFDPQGLEISIIEVLDGAKISEKMTTEYTLLINGEKISESTKIEEGEQEIIVKSNSEGVRSTSFVVTGVITKQLQTLDAIFDEILTNNNFTVSNKIGGENQVNGLVNDDAIYWTSNVEAYFSDEGFGYATLNGDTFRYKIVKGKFKNAQYIKDLGPKAHDAGLWSSDTVDEHADKRISNYNMRGLTETELNDTRAYLKTVKPVEGNANKYLLDNNYVKWLFNLIGHTSLCFSPAYHLGSPDKIGGVKGEVYVEVKDNGLHIELIRNASYAMFEPCSADITHIGTTTIPGKRAFLADPHFGITKTSLDVLKDSIGQNNYQLQSSHENKTATFNQDYVYGDFLKDSQGVNFNALNVKENNKIDKDPGFYQLNVSGNVVTLGEMVNMMDLPYLSNYLIMNNMSHFFIEDEVNPNHYTYQATQESETLSQLTLLLSIFGSADDNSEIKGGDLNIIMSEDNAKVIKATFTFTYKNDAKETITLTNFGEAKNIIIENYIKTIY